MNNEQGKCRPHNWFTPEPGDKELWCTECDRKIALEDFNADMRTAIINSIQSRRPEDADQFRGFFGYGPLTEQYGNQPKPMITHSTSRKDNDMDNDLGFTTPQENAAIQFLMQWAFHTGQAMAGQSADPMDTLVFNEWLEIYYVARDEGREGLEKLLGENFPEECWPSEYLQQMLGPDAE